MSRRSWWCFLSGVRRVPLCLSGTDLLNDPTQRSMQFIPSQPVLPTEGGWGLGGMGGSGYKAGGGGGGGLYGGGGGGAGLDGAGGGGGCSYVHMPAVWMPTPDVATPPAPTVVEVRSNSVALSWPVLYVNSQFQAAAAYVVEMASGSVSDVRALAWGVLGAAADFAWCGGTEGVCDGTVSVVTRAVAGILRSVFHPCGRDVVRSDRPELLGGVPVPTASRDDKDGHGSTRSRCVGDDVTIRRESVAPGVCQGHYRERRRWRSPVHRPAH